MPEAVEQRRRAELAALGSAGELPQFEVAGHAGGMKPRDRFKHLLRNVPEEEKDAAAERFIRYLEIVIAIADEAEANKQGQLTDDDEPPTLSYSV